MRPAAGGFDHFGSFTADGQVTERFYSAEVLDVDYDGTMEIRAYSKDCDPTCAAGTTSEQSHRWTGSEYETV